MDLLLKRVYYSVLKQVLPDRVIDMMEREYDLYQVIECLLGVLTREYIQQTPVNASLVAHHFNTHLKKDKWGFYTSASLTEEQINRGFRWLPVCLWRYVELQNFSTIKLSPTIMYLITVGHAHFFNDTDLDRSDFQLLPTRFSRCDEEGWSFWLGFDYGRMCQHWFPDKSMIPSGYEYTKHQSGFSFSLPLLRFMISRFKVVFPLAAPPNIFKIHQVECYLRSRFRSVGEENENGTLTFTEDDQSVIIRLIEDPHLPRLTHTRAASGVIFKLPAIDTYHDWEIIVDEKRQEFRQELTSVLHQSLYSAIASSILSYFDPVDVLPF